MDELAAKHVLFDFEIITLLTLVAGVACFRLALRFCAGREELESPDYDLFDLGLMFLPALIFLIAPLMGVLKPPGDVELPAEPVHGNEALGGVLVNLLVFFFIGVMVYGILAWVRNRSVIRLFGLDRLSIPAIALVSVAAGVTSVLLCSIYLGGASQDFLEKIFGELDAQEPVESFRKSDSILHFVLSTILACVVVPVVEEFVFRGYMYGTLKRLTNPVFSAVVVGALFAVVHANLPALLPLWVFSIVLCLIYEASKCLWVAVGTHAFFNAANIVLIMQFQAPK